MYESIVPCGRRLLINSSGKVDVLGIDFETDRMEVVSQNEEFIAIKVAGRNCWSGNHQSREYRSPEVLIYQILSKERDEPFDKLSVEPLFGWVVKRSS